MLCPNHGVQAATAATENLAADLTDMAICQEMLNGGGKVNGNHYRHHIIDLSPDHLSASATPPRTSHIAWPSICQPPPHIPYSMAISDAVFVDR